MARFMRLLPLAVGLLALGARGEDEPDEQDVQEEALQPDMLQKLHDKFDSNGDGKVSLQEIQAFAALMSKKIASKDVSAILDEIDTSKDGKLSLQEHMNDIHNQADQADGEELKEMEERKRFETEKFAIADKNGDGLLDASELPALFYPETEEAVMDLTVAETMKRKDTDKDGVLTSAEFWESDSEGNHQPADLSEEEQDDFNKLDLNKDGTLDKAELKAWESGRFHTEEAMKKLIEIADKDDDMHLSAEELTQSAEAISASDAQYHLIEWAEHIEL